MKRFCKLGGYTFNIAGERIGTTRNTIYKASNSSKPTPRQNMMNL